VNLQFETWPIDRCIDYARNPRKNDHAVDKVAAAIKEFGFRVPIVAKSDGLVVDGHLRLKAAKKLGLTDVPVILADDMTDAQIQAFRLSVNKVAELADWDIDLLKVELQDLDAQGFDLTLTGFELGELSDLLAEPTEGLTDEDAVPDVPEVPVTVEGDVWLLGRHRLMCGDSTSIDAVDKLMDGMKPNAVFTDPPYGIGLDKEGQKLGKSQAYGAVMNDHSGQAAKDAFALAVSMKVPELYFWGANHYSSCLPDSSCWIVWDKQGGKSVTYADCELCYTNIDKPVRMFTHIWDGFRRDSEKGEKRVHANQKPVGLFVDIWAKFNMGQVVLDLFGGSGSTLLAAEKTDRVCRMMELDPKYCDVIIKRWQDFTGQTAMLEATGQTFAELEAERIAA
jgi:DNA modification methylase